jgi:LPS export ABC transporter protein LptC
LFFEITLKRFIFFIGLLASSVLFSCKNDLDKVRVNLGEKVPLAITQDFVSLYSDSGKVILRIEAPLREDYNGTEFYSELKEGIKLTFFDGNNRVLAVLTANYALIKGSGMYIQQKVIMESTKNGTLKTESLYWNSEKKEITTVDAIEIKQENKMIYGQGLWAKQDFSEYRIAVVTGTFPLAE